jgi:hypothetical protein
MEALKGLRSVTQSSISLRDYAPRVLDAKVKVDRYTTGAAHDQIQAAMRAYGYPAQAWSAAIAETRSTQMAIGAAVEGDPVISKCPTIIQVINAAHGGKNDQNAASTVIGMAVGMPTAAIAGWGPPLLLDVCRCANRRSRALAGAISLSA